MKNVFLIWKLGKKFSFQDVNRICCHIKRHSNNINIYCITDAVRGISECQNYTLLPMHITKWNGWWAKLNLFNPILSQYKPFLYLDLDTAVVGDINNLWNHDYQDSWVVLQDFYQKGKLASGVMWIPENNNKINQIWENGVSLKQYDEKSRFDYFLRQVCEPDIFWQSIIPNIVSFKPGRRKKLTTLNEKISLVCFHGNPSINQAAKDISWVARYIGIV